jgi:histidinol-phosphate aminotransferase
MLIALEGRGEQMKTVQALVGERERLAKALRQLEWLRVYPSEANFLLCRVSGMEGRELKERLAKRGLFVRYFDTPLLQDCIRISVGLPEQTDRVIDALTNIGGERGS